MPFKQKLLKLFGRLFYGRTGPEVYGRDFDECADTYDSVSTRSMLGDVTSRMISSINLPAGALCLDLGCGSGHAAALIAEKLISPDDSTARIIGCDVSSRLLYVAGKKTAAYPVQYRHQDMLEFLSSFENSSVDLITAFWCLGYSDPGKVIKEAARVLKPGGQILVAVNTQKSLEEIQDLMFKVVLRDPFIFQRIPPVNFPVGQAELENICSGLFKELSVLDEELPFHFEKAEDFLNWLKTGGPCAGLRGSLKENRRQKVYQRLQELTKGGTDITFRYLTLSGKKA